MQSTSSHPPIFFRTGALGGQTPPANAGGLGGSSPELKLTNERTNVRGSAIQVLFLAIFGRTDLRISLSGAKFDPEADFDVRFAVARQNPRQISKKQNFSSEIFAPTFFLGVEKSNVRNRLKRVLAKFRADSGQVGRESGRSKSGWLTYRWYDTPLSIRTRDLCNSKGPDASR